MKIRFEKGIKYITFEIFDRVDFVKHVFSTRVGGVSEGNCKSLNLAFSKEKKAENVYENYRRLCEVTGLSYEGISFSKQVHGTNIKVLDLEDKGQGFLKKSNLENADGYITNTPGIVLTAFYADCVPIYFVDPKNNAIGLSHAGWRGTADNIGAVTIKKMQETFGTNPEDLLCAIGPAIGKCCFEVDYPVAEEFYDKIRFAGEYIVKDEKRNKFNIDLKNINKRHLVEAGVQPENIEVAVMCTKCNPDLFYSHRFMGKDRGSMAAMIEIMER